MDFDNDKEDFPTTRLDDPVWSEELIPDKQQLCIHQIPCHTLREATPPPQPIQEEVLPKPEPMDIKILEDLPDIIDVPK